MTVSTSTSKQSYTGNGVTTLFAFTPPFLASSDLQVYVGGVLKTLTTDYTVSGTAPYPAGANVTFLVAPGNGVSVVIARVVPYTQTLHLVANDPMPADAVEQRLDANVMMVGQLLEQQSRAVTIPITDTTGLSQTIADAASRATKGIRFDSSGNIGLTANDPDTEATLAAASAAAAASSASSASSSASSASGSASSASTSATAAATYAAALTDTSTTSVDIAIGSKSFTCSTNKQFAAGQFILISSGANSTNYMHGQVTSYNSATGALVVNVEDIGGSGTHTDWNISISGSQGAAGTTSVYAENTISGTTTAANGQFYVATTALTINVPLSTGLTSSFSFVAFAEGGNITLTPNALDKINGGTLGASVTVLQGETSLVTTDGAGNIYCGGVASITNAMLATMAANTIKVNATAGSATPSDLALAASQLLGRGATGNVAAIVLGTGLSMSGATLNAAGGGANVSTSQPGNPATFNSTVLKMCGLAQTLTPSGSGKVLFAVCGDIENTASDGWSYQLRYGTGTAPSNAAALTGTAMTGNPNNNVHADSSYYPLSIIGLVTGLTLSTAYWFDIAIAQGTGAGVTSIRNLNVVLIEL